MKVPQQKTIFASHPEVLEYRVNEFYKYNPDLEILSRTEYAAPMFNGPTIFVHSIIALVEIEPPVPQEPLTEEELALSDLGMEGV